MEIDSHPKIADAEHEVLDVVAERWSPRAFADRSVEPEKLRQLLEAARWAPSSRNEQPWRFILATKDDPEDYDRLLACLNAKNREWAYLAPVLMLMVAKTTFDNHGMPNRHAWHDVGLATGNLLAQATALDLFVHQMAGILPEKARETYGIPSDFEVVAAAAIGYLGEAEQLPEDRQEAEFKPRTRKPLAELVFAGTWGRTAPLVEE